MNGTSIAYACVLAILSIGVAFLLCVSLLLRTSFSSQGASLLYTLPWIGSGLLAGAAVLAVNRWRTKWARSSPPWLRRGVLPLLTVTVGGIASLAGSAVLYLALSLLALAGPA